MRALLGAAAILVAIGCAHGPGTGAEPGGAAPEPGGPASERARKRPPVAPEEQARIGAFARAYAAFLGRAKTPREAVAELGALARGAGFAERKPGATAGDRLLGGRGGTTLTLYRGGRRSLDEGLVIVVVPLDAPRLELRQAPLEERERFGMLLAGLHGQLDLKEWLSIPLALHGFVAGRRPIVVGESPEDPVLVVPDLLPHLSRRAQADKIIDPAEMKVLAALGGRPALEAALGALGIKPDDFATGEFVIVPADAPAFVGADEALLAGYGHEGRAFAYAAARALLDAQPERPVLLVALEAPDLRATGWPFVRASLAEAIQAARPGADGLAVRRILARSLAIVAQPLGGEPGKGVVLSPLDDDAPPEAVRQVLRGIERGGGRFQIAVETEGYGPARELSTQNLDAVELGLPVTAPQAPLPVLSTFDLYQGYRACKGLFELP